MKTLPSCVLITRLTLVLITVLTIAVFTTPTSNQARGFQTQTDGADTPTVQTKAQPKSESYPVADSPVDQAHVLSWGIKHGQILNVVLAKTAQIETQVDTRIRKVEVDTTLGFDWEVVEQNDSNCKIKQTLTRIRIQSGAPGDTSARRLDYDSDVPVYRSGISGKVAKEYKNVIGLVSTFTLPSNGRVTDFSTAAGQESKIAKLPSDSAVKKMLSSQSAVVQLSNLTYLGWSNRDQVKQPVRSELGNFTRVDDYTFERQGTETQVNVTTTALGLESVAKVDRFEGQGRVTFNHQDGLIAKSAFDLTIQSQAPYRNELTIKTNSVIKTKLTVTLKTQ